MFLSLKFYAISSLTNCLLGLFLALYVLYKSRNLATNRYFACFILSVTMWAFFYFCWLSTTNRTLADFFVRTCMIGVILIPPTFTQFTISLVKIKPPTFLLRINYFLSFLLIPFVYSSLYVRNIGSFLIFPYWPTPGPLFHIALFHFCLNIIFSHILLIRALRRSSSVIKNQILYILLAGIFGFLGGSVNFLPWYRIPILPVPTILVSLWIILPTYAILRYQFMDIEVIIKKTLVFGGLFTAVYAAFAFFAFLGQVFFEKFITTNRWISMMPSVVAVTIMLRPLENFLINVTDKRLFQKKYDYRKLVKIFTSEVLTVLDLEKLIKLTKDKLTEIMKLESCDVAIGARAADSKLKIPIILHNQTMGTLLLGNKKSDEDYTQEDLDILHPLAKALGIAISNAKLFEELAKTRAEMAQKDKMATIGTLAAGMAHEIRNPMTTIRNFADYLPERYDDKEFMNKFDRLIPKEIDRIENIARSLLEFSSSEGEKDDEDFGAKDVIKTVLSLLEPQYRFSGIGVSSDCKGGCVIRANKGRAQDAIFNITKYIFAEAPKGSNVSINVTETIKSVYISIRNKDLITAEYVIKDVFEPVSGLYREKRGFGFDLFMAKQLIERNNGTLNIFSNNRTGSEFRVYFKSASV